MAVVLGRPGRGSGGLVVGNVGHTIPILVSSDSILLSCDIFLNEKILLNSPAPSPPPPLVISSNHVWKT